MCFHVLISLVFNKNKQKHGTRFVGSNCFVQHKSMTVNDHAWVPHVQRNNPNQHNFIILQKSDSYWKEKRRKRTGLCRGRTLNTMTETLAGAIGNL